VTPKLLLADDSVTIQRVIELTFADEDVQVLAVGDGRQAIERVQADRPDIVLADIGMPERDGYEVAAFIKNDPQLSHIPVLLLTGAFEPIDEVKARAVGCDGVLVKPFEPQMVISRVRDLLAGNRSTELHPEQRAYQASTAAARSERLESPSSPQAAESPGTSLEDYFDRLDAALASKTVPPPPQYQELTPVPYPTATRPAPGPTAHHAAPATRPPMEVAVPAAPPPPVPPVVIGSSPASAGADAAFGSMAPVGVDLSDWDPSSAQREPDALSSFASAPPSRAVAPPPPVAVAPAPPPPAPEPPSLEEAFAALLAAEQGQPMAPPRIDPDSNDLIDEVVRRVIARMGSDSMKSVVLDAAERLVREEIARIKGK
jgi:CheY-like chemotaxis protein